MRLTVVLQLTAALTRVTYSPSAGVLVATLTVLPASHPAPHAPVGGSPAPHSACSATLVAVAVMAAQGLAVPALALLDGARGQSQRVLCAGADRAGVGALGEGGHVDLHDTQGTAQLGGVADGRG